MLVTLASAVPEIWLRASKLKMGHVILTMPLSGMVCHPLAMVNLFTKFEVFISTHYEVIKGDTKCRKWDGLGSYRSLEVSGDNAIR